MLNTTTVLLTILIDFLVQILTIVEWITPSKNILIIAFTLLAFRSRWTWNAFIPSFLVYFYPNIKSYIQNHIHLVQDMGRLDLLLNANSLTQHALFLKDRLAWLYREEISLVLRIMQGDLSFKVRFFLITAIFIFFGYFNWTSTVFQLIVLHVLLKQSTFGSFYRGIGQNIMKFSDFALFYKNLKSHPFPHPFKLENNIFTIKISEIIDIKTNIVHFTTETEALVDPEFIILLKPIVSRMKESISDWAVDSQNSRGSRTWKWSKTVKFDYNSDELDFFHLIHDIITS